MCQSVAAISYCKMLVSNLWDKSCTRCARLFKNSNYKMVVLLRLWLKKHCGSLGKWLELTSEQLVPKISPNCEYFMCFLPPCTFFTKVNLSSNYIYRLTYINDKIIFIIYITSLAKQKKLIIFILIIYGILGFIRSRLYVLFLKLYGNILCQLI